MTPSTVQVAPDGSGKNIQTFTDGTQHAQAVILVDSSGTAYTPLTNQETFGTNAVIDWEFATPFHLTMRSVVSGDSFKMEDFIGFDLVTVNGHINLAIIDSSIVIDENATYPVDITSGGSIAMTAGDERAIELQDINGNGVNVNPHPLFGAQLASTSGAFYSEDGTTYFNNSGFVGNGNGITGLTATQVGLGNVTNDAQTKDAIVPNTAPSSGQILVGNAGGTAYAKQSVSGNGATISCSSSGVITISAIAIASLATSTSTAIGVGSIELGHASDTTIARSGAGAITVEGVQVILSGAALGTPASGTLTNCTALPVSGITASTSTAIGVGSIELGHASDTTIARSGAGAITVEGVQVILSGAALGTPASGTLTNCTSLPVAGITASTSTALGVGSVELGHASDTTIARSGAGAITVEGVQVILSGAALGTPSSGTLSSCSGLPVSTGVSGLGTGVATALAANVGSAGAPITFNGALGTPSSGTGTNLTGTADGLTAGDVTRNHAVYAGASPPTVDVGIFTISKTGIDLKTAATSDIFTVPASRKFVAINSLAIVTAVTSAGAGTETFQIRESGASGNMTSAGASASGTPAVGIYYEVSPTSAGGPYTACAAGNKVQVAVATSHAGSTAVTGTVFVTGYYTQ